MVSQKKSSVLYILDILREYTDSNHCLTYAGIIDKLKSLYDLDIERKTVARDIDLLIYKGYDIIKRGNNGVYLASRKLEEGELLYLIDAVYSSKSIPSKYAKELVEKLTEDYSIYDKKRYKYLEKLDDQSKTNNKQLFYTIEILNQAIEQGKKVEFQYLTYGLNKQKELKYDGKKYKISPYFMVNNHGNYYLVCNYDKYNNLANYKIESIANINILDEQARPLTSLPNTENFSVSKYISEHIYMVTGKTVSAKLKVASQKYINDIVGWFGDNISFNLAGDQIYAHLTVNEEALVYWALQYAEQVEVLEPQSTRDKIKGVLNVLNKKYGE